MSSAQQKQRAYSLLYRASKNKRTNIEGTDLNGDGFNRGSYDLENILEVCKDLEGPFKKYAKCKANRIMRSQEITCLDFSALCKLQKSYELNRDKLVEILKQNIPRFIKKESISGQEGEGYYTLQDGNLKVVGLAQPKDTNCYCEDCNSARSFISNINNLFQGIYAARLNDLEEGLATRESNGDGWGNHRIKYTFKVDPNVAKKVK
jgi:hypothetical protein